MELRIFAGDTTSFDTGGIVISPLKSSVTEEANGVYNLNLTVARDDLYGRHKWVKPMNIVYASVPSKNMPIKRVTTTTGMVDRWTVSGKYELVWSLTISEARFESEVIDYMRHTVPRPTEQEAIDYVTKRFSKSSREYSPVPMYKTISCTDIATRIPHGSAVNALHVYDNCIFCVYSDGSAGYVKKESAHHVGTIQGDVWEIVDTGAKTGTAQPFRIVSITSRNGVYVDAVAQHIYFDAQAKEIMFGEIVNETLSAICERMNENGQITYHAGADVYINGNYAASNAVQLAVQLCDEYDLQLVRDGWDAYFFPAENTERGYMLETGKNIVTYSATEDVSNLKTRFVPYVDEEEYPDDAVDSQRINDYIKVYAGLIQGETVEDAQEKARKRFSDGADLPEVSIDISAARGAIDGASIFDSVRVIDKALEIDYTAKINRVEYDPINEAVVSLALGVAQGRLTRVFTASNGTWQNIDKGVG